METVAIIIVGSIIGWFAPGIVRKLRHQHNWDEHLRASAPSIYHPKRDILYIVCKCRASDCTAIKVEFQHKENDERV